MPLENSGKESTNFDISWSTCENVSDPSYLNQVMDLSKRTINNTQLSNRSSHKSSILRFRLGRGRE